MEYMMRIYYTLTWPGTACVVRRTYVGHEITTELATQEAHTCPNNKYYLCSECVQWNPSVADTIGEQTYREVSYMSGYFHKIMFSGNTIA